MILIVLRCTQSTYYKGQHFPELAIADGIGTILFFYSENLREFQLADDSFGETEFRENLINRLNIDLKILLEEYPELRVIKINITQNKYLFQDHKVYDIPTLILYDNMGYEVKRWIPSDYSRGVGRIEIEKSLNELRNTQEKSH